MKEGVYKLYDDDGETFGYERGEYSWRELRVTRNAAGQLAGTVSRADSGRPDNLGTVNWTYMTR